MPKEDLLSSFVQTRKKYLDDPQTLPYVVASFLANIEARNNTLNAFVRTYDKEASQRAVDLSTKEGPGKLAGLILGLKDLFAYEGHPVQAASRILEGYTSPFSATAVERLLAQDAIILGHQNCDEFGMGSANTYSTYGPALHPHNPTCSPGGTSGGSAAAVAAHMCHAALGTDTGGSIRQPAALCGIIGFKPTYSRIPRHGVIAHASSFDTVGLLAHHIHDIAAILEVIAGHDPYDNTSAPHPVPPYTQQLTFEGKARIAYFDDIIQHPTLQPAIRRQVSTLIHRLDTQGHQAVPTTLPLLPYAASTYYILTAAEASANLARYDGVRFGKRASNDDSLETMYIQTRSQGLGTEAKRRILLGTFLLSASNRDAYHTQAQRVRRLIKEALEEILQTHDFLLLPTTPTTAFATNRKNVDPTEYYLADSYTVLANLAGLPAISIPYGHDESGMPIGLQLIGRPFQEAQLLAFANQIISNEE